MYQNVYLSVPKYNHGTSPLGCSFVIKVTIMKLLVTDIGGTFIKYAVMDQDMSILSRGRIPTPRESARALVDGLCELYESSGEVSGLAISLPGIIDSDEGRVVMGGALRYNDGFALGDALKERISVPICMENDAKCAAMAEAGAGSLRDVKDGLVIIFGTMIGGGIIKDGKLWRGRHFSAGEVSYISTDRGPVPERETVWGNRCSVLALCRDYAREKGLDPESVNGEMVFEAVLAGDEAAKRSLDRFTGEIAVQLFNLQTVLDPERIAIGGGISAQPVLIEYIRRHLDTFYESFPYPITRSEVVACRFLNDANLYGAFQCFISRFPQTWAAEETI